MGIKIFSPSSRQVFEEYSTLIAEQLISDKKLHDVKHLTIKVTKQQLAMLYDKLMIVNVKHLTRSSKE